MNFYSTLLLVAAASFALIVIWIVLFRAETSVIASLRKSAILFGLPILLLVTDNYYVGVFWFLPPLLVVIFEEALKVVGLMLASSSRAAFALLATFGVWELAIVRPIIMLEADGEVAQLISQNGSMYVLLSVMAVLMHLTTAGIYVYYGRKLWPLSLIFCIAVHWVFNATRGLYFTGDSLLISPWLLLLDFMVFGSAAAAIGYGVRRKRNNV